MRASVVRTDAFDKKYAYDGDDLGATYTSAKTGFKVWAPTATKVELVTYQSDDVNAEVDKTIDMASEDKGVWSALVKNLASGTAYSYKLTFADGTVNVSADRTRPLRSPTANVPWCSPAKTWAPQATACRNSARPLTPPSPK